MSIRRTVDTNLYMEHHISAARHTYVQVRRINARQARKWRARNGRSDSSLRQ